MKYANPEVLDRLAADYTVGVLRGQARRRFERVCDSHPAAMLALLAWEDRLLPLATAAPPVVPSDGCWPRIEQRLDEISGRRSSSLRNRPTRWLALAAGLAAVAVLVGRVTIWAPPGWEPVAALAPADAAPLWQIERDAAASRLNLRVVGTVTLPESKSYELWVLPVGAGNPVSLGLLPRTGNLERHLDERQRRLLLAGAQVAVSIEPAGGSPTGVPTGPVVIVAPIVKSS